MFRCMLQTLLLGVFLSSTLDAGPVRIDLLGRIQLSTEVARLSDIARVSGGDLITRRKIAELDIISLDGAEATKRVTERQVQLRIQLAGIRSTEFRIFGSKYVVVTKVKRRSPETRVLEFLKPAIADRLGVAATDVELKLAKPIPVNADRFFSEGTTLEHTLGSEVKVGSLTTQIRVRDDGRLTRTQSVSLDIQVFREVFVVPRFLDAGTVITTIDVRSERRLVSGRDTFVTTSVIGKKTKRDLEAGSVISKRDLERVVASRPEIIIKSRDLVEIVVRSSALQAKVSGAVALQRGAAGDSIRVKNPRSGKVLTAKVVAAGLVEVRL